MTRTYFTFGTDPQYPFGINDYVVVEADGLSEACLLFNLVHPPREGSSLINCAFYYEEESFNKFRDQYYKDVEPAEVIRLDVQRRAD